MCAGLLKFFKTSFLCLFFLTTSVFARQDSSESHMLVAMRMIGHRVLLHAGDSTSLVLPITKTGNQYNVKFDSDFEFNPDTLRNIIDNTLKKAAVRSGYIVEVKKCHTNEVVYSYEISLTAAENVIPCGGRKLPFDCYSIYITMTNTGSATSSPGIVVFKPGKLSQKNGAIKYIIFAIACILVLLGITWFIYFRKEKTSPVISSEVFCIGEYWFDKKNMTLKYANEITELSSKESDLLFLLFTSENKTLERDSILKAVWANDGDYMGRTLDVFISRLRKKLEADTNIKIINVRGVGYKMILNGVE